MWGGRCEEEEWGCVREWGSGGCVWGCGVGVWGMGVESGSGGVGKWSRGVVACTTMFSLFSCCVSILIILCGPPAFSTTAFCSNIFSIPPRVTNNMSGGEEREWEDGVRVGKGKGFPFPTPSPSCPPLPHLPSLPSPSTPPPPPSSPSSHHCHSHSHPSSHYHHPHSHHLMPLFHTPTPIPLFCISQTRGVQNICKTGRWLKVFLNALNDQVHPIGSLRLA